MGKLGWCCLLLFSLCGQLWAVPRTSEELSAWAPVNNEEAKLSLDPLTSRRSFQQILTRILGAQTEDNSSKADLGPPRFSPRESVEEAPVESFSRNMLLRRLWESARKQYKERRNLSQCFWKYCV
ncbi:urotensin-2-like [Crotalus tigris]|uniref:urotensin-2-like n=1 Tax=Crotalus tigris TaxID=88082 RepID=UPI00192F44F8|nr:urotensin-2-like [Crotalus tigris]